jgi:hypothetical protein
MALQFPNRTGQAGTYHTGSPNYVDVDNAKSPIASMVTFAAKATDDSWSDNDTVTIEVRKDSSNWWVGTATWDATNEYLELTTEEDSAGTLSDADDVTVTAVPTRDSFLVVSRGAEFVAEAGTTRTLSAADHGRTIRCTSATAVTITCDDALPVGFHCLVIQEGAGTVSIAIEGTDTVNGDTAAIDVAAQYQAAYIYQATAGAWVVVA